MAEDRGTFWQNCYAKDYHPWHSSSVHPILIKWLGRLVTRVPSRILVPLCGRSVDLQYLYKLGHHVVGIELVEKPVREIFAEFGLQCIEDRNEFQMRVLRTPDSRLQVYICDVVKMDWNSLGKFDFIWDRAAFVALYKQDRQAYADLIRNVVKPETNYLLQTTSYDQRYFSGPPYDTPLSVIEQVFGNQFVYTILEQDISSGSRQKPDGTPLVFTSYTLNLVLRK